MSGDVSEIGTSSSPFFYRGQEETNTSSTVSVVVQDVVKRKVPDLILPINPRPIGPISVIRSHRSSSSGPQDHVSHRKRSFGPSSDEGPEDMARRVATDISFIVNGRLFGANREILKCCECASFFLPYLKSGKKGPLVVEGIDADVLEALLRVIENGNFSDKLHTNYSLYAFCQKENFRTLVTRLTARLKDRICWRFLWLFLLKAREVIPTTRLYHQLFAIALHNPAYLWMRLDCLSPEFFQSILKHEKLRVNREEQLLKVIWLWLKIHKISDRKIVDKCLKWVNYGALSKEELNKCLDWELSDTTPLFSLRVLKKIKRPSKPLLRNRVVSYSLKGFNFEVEEKCTKKKEGKVLFISQSFRFSKEHHVYFLFNKVLCRLIFERSGLLYLGTTSKAINQNLCYLWVQAETQEEPFIGVYTLDELRGGVESLLPFDQGVRFSLTIFA